MGKSLHYILSSLFLENGILVHLLLDTGYWILLRGVRGFKTQAPSYPPPFLRLAQDKKKGRDVEH